MERIDSRRPSQVPWCVEVKRAQSIGRHDGKQLAAPCFGAWQRGQRISTNREDKRDALVVAR